LPLIIGMPIMLVSNVDLVGGTVNGSVGTLKSIHYFTDANGNHFLHSCILHSDTSASPSVSGLDVGDIACIADSVTLTFKH
ncbi:hypothetical protein BJ165DRAFT_1330797, partial [Panaeolus papilionaceus]